MARLKLATSGRVYAGPFERGSGGRMGFGRLYPLFRLYGANPAAVVTIFQGTGGTGKSTLLTAVHSALGDYCTTIEITSLLQTDWRRQQKSAPREDLLKLRGAMGIDRH